jgi:hypothetical protein
MMTYTWITPWDSLVDRLNAWGDGDASGYVSFAMWAVDGLHYLADLDDRAFTPPPGYVTTPELLGYNPDTVSLNHIRWATGNAITALDLCAACIGRVVIGPRPKRGERSLVSFDPSSGRDRRDALTELRHKNAPAAAWIREVLNDPERRLIKRTRDALVHRRLPRHVQLGGLDHDSRISLKVRENGSTVPARELLVVARDFATRHVEAFVAEVRAGSW